jgi:hypothetical protein
VVQHLEIYGVKITTNLTTKTWLKRGENVVVLWWKRGGGTVK